MLALGSVKASPGVTTTALVLAAVWTPGRRLLLVEADPDGGVLAARFRLGLEPGLTTLAAAARRQLSPDDLDRHTQQLPGGVPALVGPAAPEQAHAALDAAGNTLAGQLGRLADRDVLVDCGRLRPQSPALPLAHAADLVALVARPRLDEIQHLAHRIPALRQTGLAPAVILVGDRPYPPGHVAAALGTPVLGVLADDPRGAAALGAGRADRRALARSLLIRSARDLHASIKRHLHARLAGPPAVPLASGRQGGLEPSVQASP